MGRKSTVWSLPREIREALIQRVIDSNFSGYESHEVWLKEQGHSIGKSSIHRFCREIERAEMEKRAAILHMLMSGKADYPARSTSNQIVVQIIDPAAQSIRFVQTTALPGRIEAAIRGLA